jgi:phage terminase small subunit
MNLQALVSTAKQRGWNKMPVLDNPRHEIFAKEIAKGSSKREAYIKAGYETENLEATSASASRLLTDAKVQARINEIQSSAAKRAEITIERTLLELAKIGYADIRKAAKWGSALSVKNDDGEQVVVTDVAVLNSDEIDDDTAVAIAEVSRTKEGIKIKMHDKLGALEKIGKHLGMFIDKVEHSGSIDVGAELSERLAAARKKAAEEG